MTHCRFSHRQGPGRLLSMGLFIGAMVLGAGCRPPLLDPALAEDVDGAWSYSETLSSSSVPGSCTTAGTLSFVQQGAVFSGTFSRTFICQRNADAVETQSESGQVSSGQVRSQTVQFRIDGCLYRGVMSDGGRRMTGSILCTELASDASIELETGNFQADRVRV